MDLGEFFEKKTKVFDVTITYEDVNPDIRNDVVTFYLKDNINSDPVLSKDADCTTYGETGKARIKLTAEDMDIPSGTYYAFIDWKPGADVHPVLKNVAIVVRDS